MTTYRITGKIKWTEQHTYECSQDIDELIQADTALDARKALRKQHIPEATTKDKIETSLSTWTTEDTAPLQIVEDNPSPSEADHQQRIVALNQMRQYAEPLFADLVT